VSDLRAILADDERMANLCMNRGQEIKRLVAENRALRETLIEQARAINILEMSVSAPSRTRNIAAAGPEGAGAGSSVIAGIRVDAGIDEC
jgi:hypothetical protein